MAAAAHALLQDDTGRILVFYPVRALIQDQLDKWTRLLGRLDMRPAFVDGSVPMKERNEKLLTNRVLLMTPDVAHAWMMNHLSEAGVRVLRENLRLLVLDEAHVYDGVFGTNMAFFLRRLQAIACPHRLIRSTATLGKPGDFIRQLTGRETLAIGAADDGAKVPPREILLTRPAKGDGFDSSARLLRALTGGYAGRFLAFADSRKMVERLTAASYRDEGTAEDAEEKSKEPAPATKDTRLILPYRSGYETEDRNEIQSALAKGRLKGVVATSALELGLDIGEIDLVVLLNTPPSMKAFWQRIGRTGRKTPGKCVFIDTRHAIVQGGLEKYLRRPIDPNWLYLSNRYAQYTNALCAAAEWTECEGRADRSYFASLPEQFTRFLENELNPTEIIPADMYPLKQRAQAGPHREFPLRSGIEQDFKVQTSMGENRGNLSFSQVLREGYPGAVYYYMADPYRVTVFSYRNGEITISREKHFSTQPLTQTMVFPDFGGGLLTLQRATDGFVAEAEMQVSERVTGFREKRGGSEIVNEYGPGSPYSQRPLTRFIRTSGVCWHFGEQFASNESLGAAILNAFCNEYGIQPRDVGLGRFHANRGPDSATAVQGLCIFDNANGSLRLTERLAASFASVVASAQRAAEAEEESELARMLKKFARLVAGLSVARATDSREMLFEVTAEAPGGDGNEWITVIAPDERAIFIDMDGSREVTVVRHLFTPKGLQYQLIHPQPTIRWMVPTDALQPIVGVTRMLLYNTLTGEEKEIQG